MKDQTQKNPVDESLQKMEALLSHSTLGIHILFENQSIAAALKEVKDDRDFLSVDKMKKVQDSMTELVARKSYIEKLSFLRSLHKDEYQLLVRAYFHIVENTLRATSNFKH